MQRLNFTRVSLAGFSCLLLCSMGVARTLASEKEPQFFDSLSALCGSTYAGEMTFPQEGQDSFAGQPLVATFLDCSETQVRVPFAVGDDHSRTWIFTRTNAGLSLKHDHRHKDGSPDEVTNYGGLAGAGGSHLSQSFAADEFTQTLIPEASTNVWTISLSEDLATLTYHLTRHDQPRFTAVLHRTAD